RLDPVMGEELECDQYGHGPMQSHLHRRIAGHASGHHHPPSDSSICRKSAGRTTLAPAGRSCRHGNILMLALLTPRCNGGEGLIGAHLSRRQVLLTSLLCGTSLAASAAMARMGSG